jgi:undecaprenyl pyrophosphate synthase
MPPKDKNKKTQNNFKQDFIREFERSLLLDDGVKKYWIQNADQLPEPLLQNLYQVVKAKNDKVDEYIRAALADDPDHKILQELKTTVSKIKKETRELEEKSQAVNPEELLEEQIKNI